MIAEGKMQAVVGYINEHYPNAGENLRSGYDRVTDFVAPLWNKISPAIPSSDDLDRCFTLGWEFEAKHFGKDDPQPNRRESSVQRQLDACTEFVKNTLRTMKRQAPPPQDAMTILQRMYTQIDPDESPLQGCVKAIKQQIEGLKDDDPEVMRLSARWLLLSVHAGRESYRRQQHLVHNLPYAGRWIVLWSVMSYLHPWSRNLGLLAGFVAAVGARADLVSNAELNGYNKGICGIPDSIFGGVRKALHADKRVTQSVMVSSVTLLLWTKIGLPAPSPLISSIMTLMMAGAAGNYLGAPIEPIKVAEPLEE